MLISPAGFQTLAHADSQYADIETFDWSEGNRTIEYTYDANGSIETKTTKATSTQDVIETVEYEYNLQNRLKKQTVKDGQYPPNILSWTGYTYNESGIRVKSEHFDGTNTTTTLYLVDSFNPTGYAQTIEETIEVSTSSVPQTKTQIQYTIGDDIISQAKSHWNWQDIGGGQYDWGFDTTDATQYLLYDGHGSTRQILDSTGITDVYNYDAYGVSLGYDDSVSSPKTNLRYAGEYFDENISNYYNRSRWYSPATGRFNRMDTYPGSSQDPQSLHKYLYCHANPVNNVAA